MNEFSWERDLFNLDINMMASVFSTTIKKIMTNFILHEIIICDDKDPPWINNRVKILIHERTSLCKNYRKNNDNQVFEKFTLLQGSRKKLMLSQYIRKMINSRR